MTQVKQVHVPLPVEWGQQTKTTKHNGVHSCPQGKRTCALQHLSKIISPGRFTTIYNKNMKKDYNMYRFRILKIIKKQLKFTLPILNNEPSKVSLITFPLHLQNPSTFLLQLSVTETIREHEKTISTVLFHLRGKE